MLPKIKSFAMNFWN